MNYSDCEVACLTSKGRLFHNLQKKKTETKQKNWALWNCLGGKGASVISISSASPVTLVKSHHKVAAKTAVWDRVAAEESLFYTELIISELAQGRNLLSITAQESRCSADSRTGRWWRTPRTPRLDFTLWNILMCWLCQASDLVL